MKRIFVQVLTLIAGVCATASFANAQSWGSQGWGVGASGGIGFAFGDVSSSFSNAKYHLGVSVQKELFSYFDLKGKIMFGALEGEKSEYENGDPAGLRFRSDYVTYHAMLKFRLTDLILEDDEAKFSMYLQAGAGLLHFKSTLYNDVRGTKAESGTTTDITVPLGVGFEYRFTPALSANIDFLGHITSATNLDVVKNSFFKDIMFTPSIGVAYTFGKSASTNKMYQSNNSYETVIPVAQQVVTEEIVEEVVVEKAAPQQVEYNTKPIAPQASDDDFSFDFNDLDDDDDITPVATQPQDDVIEVRAEAAPLTSREGLIYRVQIAAVQQYNPGKAMSLKNKYALSQVPFEEIDGGLYKYTIGVNRTLAEAMAFRDAMVAKGIADAFVVPYYVGKRITNQEARNLLQQK